LIRKEFFLNRKLLIDLERNLLERELNLEDMEKAL
jgi:hypothetical protein